MVMKPKWEISGALETYNFTQNSPLYIYLEQNTTMQMLGDDINIKAAVVGGRPPF